MACAAQVQIGPTHQCFWALHLRGVPGVAAELRERTHTLRRRGRVDLSEGRVRVNDAGVALELRLEEEPGIEALCPHGRQQVWTRKQAGVRAQGTLALGGAPPSEIDALAVIDDTVGHHARETEWRWSAGVGTGADGTSLAWNLVSGVNDPPSGSERAVWVDGSAHECPPVRFRDDLQAIACEDGSVLHFQPEAERARRENLLLASSDYRAPFGTFAGTLPGPEGPLVLAAGLGVVEHHRARW